MAIKNSSKKSSSSKAPKLLLVYYKNIRFRYPKQSKIAHSLSSGSDELKTDLQVTIKVPK
jgi:hypothetical protein